ncbi:MAG: hypothetical protein JNL11_20650 [Bdellovibrionaceae bacterium]|nr:hypothetical protein [Pseudobdellovibrionaceae bacterium]
MKSFKTKLITTVGGLGALCVMCCTLPIMGLLGLGTIEAFFCENKYIQWFGVFLIGGAVFLLLARKFKSISLFNSCSIDCGCNPKTNQKGK